MDFDHYRCSQSYFLISEITIILMSFFVSYNVISYLFLMKKNVKVKKVEPFADCFQPFLSLSQYTDTPTAGTTSSTHQLLLTPLV